ncbi:MAG: CRISPR-associated protein Cas5 [Candidatus Aminicenantaceae bacterium]
MEIFSFKVSSELASFRKFDTSDSLYLTYSLPPRTSILGMLGALVGKAKSEGDRLPWMEELKETLVGIRPEGIPFPKTILSYTNTSGYANYTSEGKGKEKKIIGSTLIVKEQVLINPSYTIFVELTEKTKQICASLKKRTAIFTPYLGKNEFPAELEYLKMQKARRKNTGKEKISTIWPFEKQKNPLEDYGCLYETSDESLFLENLPYDYDQYNKHLNRVFAYAPGNSVDLERVLTKHSDMHGKFARTENDGTIYLIGGSKDVADME